MDPIKNLYDAASAVESELGFLEETLSALGLWHENIESEVPRKEDAKWGAAIFNDRFPSYHAMHYILLKDLTEHITKLRDIDDAIYALAREEKAKEAAASTES